MYLLMKEAPVRELLKRIKSPKEHLLYIKKILDAFIYPFRSHADEIEQSGACDLPEPLTKRELEVLRKLSRGLTNREIAADMFISLNTVKAHLKNLYGKLEVTSRAKAVSRAGELNLI